jgi:hypothetical protein
MTRREKDIPLIAAAAGLFARVRMCGCMRLGS